MRVMAILMAASVLVLGGCARRGPATVKPWAPVVALSGPAGGYELRAVDPLSGRPPAGPSRAPIPLEGNQYSPAYALSDDGAWLAVIAGEGQACEPYAGGTSCRPRAQALHIVDLQAWRQVTGTLPISGWAGPIAFSPDASRVALAVNEAAGSTLLLADAHTGRVTAQQAIDFRPSLLGFTAADKELVAYGQALGADPGITQPPPPEVLAVDAATLAVRWQRVLDGIASGDWCTDRCDAEYDQRVMASWQPAAVLARDGRTLAVVHADADQLTVVDVAARTIRTVDITRQQSWLERLLPASVVYAKGPMLGATKSAVLSADGSRLYVAGQTMDVSIDSSGRVSDGSTHLGLQEVDVATGRVLSTAAPGATDVWSTPDGAFLVAEDWEVDGPRTEVLAAGGLRVMGRVSGWDVLAVRPAANDLTLTARRYGSDTSYAVLDAASLRVLVQWSADSYWAWLTAH